MTEMQGTTYLNEMRHPTQVILDKHFELKRIQVHILIGLPAASLFASSLQPVVGLGGDRVALTIIDSLYTVVHANTKMVALEPPGNLCSR